MKRLLLFSGLTLGLFFGWYFFASATKGILGVYYSAGPAASGIDRTGGPISGGLTCTACHSGGSGSTSIAFTLKNSSNVAVTSYTAGSSYTAEFQVTSTLPIKGFQAVALKAGNLQAGTFTTVLTTQSTISTLGGRQYPEHQGSSGSGLFKFTWVAPVAGSGNVTFYACGNGVNGNGAPVGDLPSTPISAIITETSPTTISYGVIQVCNNGSNLNATISGTTGGTFTASPAGLTINSSTGHITTSSSSPGLYTVTYTFAGGTTTKQIRIRPIYNISNTASICNGQSIFLAGANQTTAGVYTSNLLTVAGCDSIVTTTLTIKQPTFSSMSATICAGDSILVGGQYVSSSGMTNVVTTNSVGCDSTISLSLSFHSAYNVLSTMTICQGEEITFNGNQISTSGIYFDNGQTINGCDSITTLDLTVTAVNVGVTNNTTSLTAQASGAAYQWLDCANGYAAIPGANGQTYAPTSNGNYAVKVTEQNCSDTSDCTLISGLGIEEFLLGEIKIFPNPSNGKITVAFPQKVDARLLISDCNGKMVFTTNLVNQQEYSADLKLEAGIYFVEIVGDKIASRLLWLVK
ncbi:MAG: choice-of-anchor V domain-containing protein [Crocinitomicaceae bacterium]